MPLSVTRRCIQKRQLKVHVGYEICAFQSEKMGRFARRTGLVRGTGGQYQKMNAQKGSIASALSQSLSTYDLKP